MDEKNNFAPVPKPSGAVEKSAPDAKRILAGMVVDPLAVADAQLESWCKKGERHFYGTDAPQNYSEAAKWFRMAGERGHVSAQCWLGIFYERGHGVPQDLTEAAKWFQQAASQGNALSQFLLGQCYLTGRGISQDCTQAVMWFRKAAEQEVVSAQYELGFCYEHGLGLEMNCAEAIKWYSKAAERGNTDAAEKLTALSSKVSNPTPNKRTEIVVSPSQAEASSARSSTPQNSTHMQPANLGIILAKLIATVLLFAALGLHAFDYYTILRWIVCGVAAFTAFQAAQIKTFGWMVVFIIVAIVLNPIAPLHLKRDTWAIVDAAAAVLLLLSIVVMDIRKPRP
jgi:hypothetical protein